MAEGGGSALQFGWLGDARNAPLLIADALARSGACSRAARRPVSCGGRVGRPVAADAARGDARSLLMYFARLERRSARGSASGPDRCSSSPCRRLIARGLAATGARRRDRRSPSPLSRIVAGAPTTAHRRLQRAGHHQLRPRARSARGRCTVTPRRAGRPRLAARDDALRRPSCRWSRWSRDRSDVEPDPELRRSAAWPPASRSRCSAAPTDGLGIRANARARVKAMYETANARAGAGHRARAAHRLRLGRPRRTRRVPGRRREVRRRAAVLRAGLPERRSVDLPRAVSCDAARALARLQSQRTTVDLSDPCGLRASTSSSGDSAVPVPPERPHRR